MRCVAALLAAALLGAGATGCGDGGAEPGAPVGATLMLDFTPNAVHSGIYVAQRQGFYEDEDIDLTIREPGESTDAPKLLAAGRVDLAVIDIHDLGIAREQGLDLVGLMAIVNAPLASVIARADGPVRSPRDLEGRTVGVTGLPSDEAVVDSEVEAAGGDPAAVDRVTIGFNAVPTLAADKVDAVTGFWNAEAVALRRKNVPTRVFQVDEYGAPRYPELVLVAAASTVDDRSELVDAAVRATRRGYRLGVHRPRFALDQLVASSPGLDRDEQAAQLRVLLPDLRPAALDYDRLRAWVHWDVEHGLLSEPIDVEEAFHLPAPGELLGAEQPGD